MTEFSFVVSAWNNGRYLVSGAGYGLRIGAGNRDLAFRREWDDVTLFLEDYDKPATIILAPSFWKGCPELRSKDIGRWLVQKGHARWEKGYPPKFSATWKGERTYDVLSSI